MTKVDLVTWASPDPQECPGSRVNVEPPESEDPPDSRDCPVLLACPVSLVRTEFLARLDKSVSVDLLEAL